MVESATEYYNATSLDGNSCPAWLITQYVKNAFHLPLFLLPAYHFSSQCHLNESKHFLCIEDVLYFEGMYCLRKLLGTALRSRFAHGSLSRLKVVVTL